MASGIGEEIKYCPVCFNFHLDGSPPCKPPSPLDRVTPGPPKSLSQQVEALATRADMLEAFGGELLATIKLNVDRGHIVATTDSGKQTLARLLDSWKRAYDAARLHGK